MFEHGDGLGFAVEACTELHIVQHLTRQDFESDFALEARVIGMIDGGHATPANLGLDLVSSELLWLHGLSLTSAR